MFADAKNGVVRLKDDNMYYVRFGRGLKTLIMLPGLGESLTTVKGTALPMAFMYREFSKDYTVYMFSRRNNLPKGTTTRDIARDLNEATDILGITKAHLVGVSMGGMIAQHFAADYPEKVDRLVLVVTCAQPNPIIIESIGEWIALAKRGDHTGFMASNVRRMYSDAYYRKHRWLLPIIGRITKPSSYDRFFIQADACLAHDAHDRLAHIISPILVIGGEKDIALGAEPSREIAAAIPGARLKMYPDMGHGLYEEAKDFKRVVHDFLSEIAPTHDAM